MIPNTLQQWEEGGYNKLPNDVMILIIGSQISFYKSFSASVDATV